MERPSEPTTSRFAIALAIVIGSLFAIFATLPARDALVVSLLRGPRAYFVDGVRVQPSRPLRHLTSGQPVPSAVEISVLVAVLFAPGYLGYRIANALFRRSGAPRTTTLD